MTVKNKIGAYFYTGHRINPSHKDDEPSALYSKGRYRTKLSPRDFPEWYLFGYMYGGYGFISAKDVKYLLYVPEYTHSQSVYGNDILLISYDQPIEPFIKENGSKWYSGYDCYLNGQEIALFIDAAEKHSKISVESVRNELRKKAIWFVENNLKQKQCSCSI